MMVHRKHQPPMGSRRYDQERNLVAGTTDLAWADNQEERVLKESEREAGETIGHALNLRLQMLRDKDLRQHKLNQTMEE